MICLCRFVQININRFLRKYCRKGSIVPKISIITACRCCQSYLGDCIDSVRNQGFKDYEHVIIDDCSTDRSYKILKKFAKHDKHIKLFKAKKRLRCGSSYAYVAKKAKGEILAVLDSDDALASNAINNLITLYERNPDVKYIWTQHWMCDDRLRKSKKNGKIRKGVSSHPGEMSMLQAGVLRKHCFSHWRTFKRELLDKAQEQEIEIFREGLKSAVDKHMAYALEELGVGGFANHAMYKYRQRLGGLSFTGRRNWERMKRKFTERRQEQNIKPYPILNLSCKGMK